MAYFRTTLRGFVDGLIGSLRRLQGYLNETHPGQTGAVIEPMIYLPDGREIALEDDLNFQKEMEELAIMLDEGENSPSQAVRNQVVQIRDQVYNRILMDGYKDEAFLKGIDILLGVEPVESKRVGLINQVDYRITKLEPVRDADDVDLAFMNFKLGDWEPPSDDENDGGAGRTYAPSRRTTRSIAAQNAVDQANWETRAMAQKRARRGTDACLKCGKLR